MGGGKFQEWGLQPAGEEGTFFQKVKIHGFEAHGACRPCASERRDFHLDDDDFTLESSASSAGVTVVSSEVVFVGYGIAAPDKGLNEYAGLDVNGKIVLALHGLAAERAACCGVRLSTNAEAEHRRGPTGSPEWTEEAKDADQDPDRLPAGAAAISAVRSGRAAGGTRPPAAHVPRRTDGGDSNPSAGSCASRSPSACFAAIMRTDPQESPRGLQRRMDGLRRDIQNKQVRSAATGVQVALKGYDQTLRIDAKSGNDVALQCAGAHRRL